MQMQFEFIWALALIPILSPLIWWVLRQTTYVGYSSLGLLKGVVVLPLDLVQKILLTVAMVLVVVALAGPYYEVLHQVPLGRKGRDIVILLDRSGSMESKVGGVQKISTAKAVVEKFVRRWSNDRITLISFDYSPRLEWPPAFAERESGLHDPILRRLAKIQAGGGTSIPRALVFALRVLEASDAARDDADGGDIGGGRTVILVSDGASTIGDEEHTAITSAASDLGLSIHWILIRSSSGNRISAHDNSAMRTVRAVVEATGGQVFQTTPEGLEAAFAEVERLETAPLAFVEETERVYHCKPFIIAGLGVFALAAAIEVAKEL